MDTTPKAKRSKGSKKKRLLIDSKRANEPPEKSEGVTVVRAPSEVTPPHRTPRKVISNEREDTRSVEWQYHGRFNDSDVVVWGSPQASPVIKLVKHVDESPVSSHKVLEEEEEHERKEICEPPQFISEILALSEKIKATNSCESDLKNNGINEKDTALVPGENDVLNESYSKLFDEEMNECMVQCSQEVEATIFESACDNQNLKIEVNNVKNEEDKSKTSRYTLKPNEEKGEGSSTWNVKSTVGKAKVENHNMSTVVKKLPSGSGQPVAKGRSCLTGKKSINAVSLEERFITSDKASSSSLIKIHCNSTPHSKVQVVSSASSSAHVINTKILSVKDSCAVPKAVKSSYLDIAFDAVKESFLEDDLEILSAIPDIPENVPQSSVKTQPVKRPFVPKQPTACGTNVNTGLDDSTFFEDDVLQFLDTLESNVSCTPPIRCTPEEIEKKRKEAKSKLEKKNNKR